MLNLKAFGMVRLHGTVTHAGIAFGNPNGDIWMVQINGPQGVTSGTLPIFILVFPQHRSVL